METNLIRKQENTGFLFLFFGGRDNKRKIMKSKRSTNLSSQATIYSTTSECERGLVVEM